MILNAQEKYGTEPLSDPSDAVAIAAVAEAVVMIGEEGSPPAGPTGRAAAPDGGDPRRGVSYHYLLGDKPLTLTPGLVDRLKQHLVGAGFPTRCGPTRTTTAIWRETVTEIERYHSEGVLSLCIEPAALWTVCRHRGAATATVHGISDYLDSEERTLEAPADRDLKERLAPATGR